MQTQGSLQESNLAALLQTMQSERATGTLTLENGSDNCALYFLFGHLFHAAGPGGEGEDVVVNALGWHAGGFHFDPRAKLPAEETIKASPAELIAAAESVPAAAPTLAAADGQSAGAAAWVAAPTPEPAAAAPWNPAPATSAPSASGPQQASPLESWNATQAAAPVEAPAPAYTPVEYAPSYVPPQAASPAAPAAPIAPVIAPRPVSRPTASAGATTRMPVGSLPIPAGHVQYEGLKSAFVDFPRLLRTLRTERHTGYIRLLSGPSVGVLLFREGELIEAEAGDNAEAHGEDAFHIFRRKMDTGDGVIDVIDLDADTATAAARLLTGPPAFTGLLGRFVNFPALLEYLAEERFDGSVIVAGGSESGVILLKQGGVLAAFTASARNPTSSTDGVAALAAERLARIEVRGEDGSRAPIDTEAALARPR